MYLYELERLANFLGGLVPGRSLLKRRDLHYAVFADDDRNETVDGMRVEE